MQFNIKTLVVVLIALAAGTGLALVPPPEGLTVDSMRVLGILLGAIVLWAGNVFPEAATGMVMSSLFVILAHQTIGDAFSAFSGTTFWLLVAAFGMGAAIKACGLLERLSLILLKLFPKTYTGQIIGLVSVTTITSPIIPSKAAKCSVLSPLVRGMSDSMGYATNSKPATGMFLSYYSATCFSPAMFVTASVTTAALLGMYAPEVQAQYGWITWLLCSLPWAIPMFILNALYISRFYRPETGNKLDTSFVADRLAELGQWTRKEKIMAGIVAVTIALWISASFTGIPEWATAVFAVCASMVFGILPVQKFRSDIAWDALIFIGCAVSLGAVLTKVGVPAWLVTAIGPSTDVFFANPFLLIIGLAVLTIIVRFLILSEIGYLTVFTAFLFPLAIAVGINPWIVGFIMNAFVIVWFLPYMSSVYLTAIHSAGDGWVTTKATGKYCLVYCAISLISAFIAYPIWNLLGIWSI